MIGAIDGSLIPVRGPNTDEHLYVCHKGFHALNVTAVCNAHLPFTNFVCRWNGSMHDSAVFNASNLHVQKEGGRGRNGGLLGDRGFGIQLYLMTPLRPDHVTTLSTGYQVPEGSHENKKHDRESLWPLEDEIGVLITVEELCSFNSVATAPSSLQLLSWTTHAFIPTLHYQQM